MMKQLIYNLPWSLLLICSVACSCRAPESLRNKAKAQRYVDKIQRLDPSALTSAADTIWGTYILTDTIYVPELQLDTFFTYLPGDTVTINKEGISASVVFGPGNTALLKVLRAADTLYLTDTVYLPTAINSSVTIADRPIYTFLLDLWRRANVFIIVGIVLLLAWIVLRKVLR